MLFSEKRLTGELRTVAVVALKLNELVSILNGGVLGLRTE
jgi:hypothetical protein